MSKPSSRVTLYRLIMAGRRAHQSVLAPLHERGLEPGDDAILFVLEDGAATTEAALSDMTGLRNGALTPRLERMCGRDLLVRKAVGPALEPGYALTERGQRIRDALDEAWTQLEETLVDGLNPRQRRHLGKALKRFTQTVRPRNT